MIHRGKKYPEVMSCRLPLLSILSFIVIILPILIISGADAQDDKSLNIIYYENSPFIYNSRSGDPIGIAVDVLVPFLEERGYSITLTMVENGNSTSSLKNGKGDILVGCNINRNCPNEITYSREPLYSNWGIIYSGIHSKISTILDLEGKWVGVVEDDIYYSGQDGFRNILDSFGIKANIVKFENYNEILVEMERGQIDAGLLNRGLGNYIEGEWDIKRTSLVFSPIDIGFAVDSNNSDMVDLLNQIDNKLAWEKENPDSAYYDTLEEYFGGENERPTSFFIPSWLIRTLITLAAMVIILVMMALFLRGQVKKRTREIENANMELNRDVRRRKKVEKQLTQERNRSLFYLDLLIHDIGNIHHGLLSHIQLYDMMKEDREKADKSVRQMKDLLDRSRVLVKNINKFTQAMSQEKKLRTMDISSIIRDSLASMMLANPKIDIRTRMDLPEGGIYVKCEPLIEEIFNNLFHNAIKFHDGASGMVEVVANEIMNGESYEILISDHGKGVPEKMKNTIFSRFERSTERKHRGMGLAIVKALVKRYHGTIDVTDRVPGDHTQGATFRLVLPASDTDQ